MAIRDIHLQSIYNLHKDEDVDYLIEEVDPACWYIGVKEARNKDESDAVWNIYIICNVGNKIHINSLNGMKEHIWDNRVDLLPRMT